ncbi:MAG: type II toxin-antitoxin system RelE/ParE family toxin [Oscillospiraceae bacterium]|nr:type II toxin-antitoxin system RelE/ParE family toxin [Oscillospiraceae bacterium]MDY2863959.1 type II toxin-antitoxin system RelE/ParE family toxin [Oscillospiraceae bacterium]
MKVSVKFSPEALKDLDEIYDYIANVLKSPDAADNTVNKILDKTDLLSDNPEIGTQLFFENDLFSGYRYMVSDNYLAFYRITNESVFVDRVIYGKRDYMKILFK